MTEEDNELNIISKYLNCETELNRQDLIEQLKSSDEVNYHVLLQFQKNKNLDLLTNRFDSFKGRINHFKKLSEELLIKKLSELLIFNNNSNDDLAIIINQLYSILYDNNNNIFIIKYLISNQLDKLLFIECFLNCSDDRILQLNIDDIVISKFTIYLAHKLKLYKLKDLLNFDLYKINLILLNDIEELFIFCNSCNFIQNNLSKLHERVYKLLEKKDLNVILNLRYENYGVGKTLNDIGTAYGLTRERIRQKINKGSSIVLKFKRDFINIIKAIFIIYQNHLKMLEINKLIDIIKNENLIYYLIVLSDLDIIRQYDIHYDAIYRVIYFNNNLEIASRLTLASLKPLINKDKISDYTHFVQQVIYINYNKRKGYYLKKNINKANVFCQLIDELYPNGCKIYDNDVITNIYTKYKELFGIEEKINDRNLSTYVIRNNYCLIDSGTVINREKVPDIDKDFKFEILNFIIKQESVYYNTIFEKYKEQFNYYGINNWYYVKGIIDGFIDDSFVSEKHYIHLNYINYNPINKIKEFINNKAGIITLESIQNEVPGLKTEFLNNVISLINQLISLSKDTYIKLCDLSINDKDIILLTNCINFLFDKYETNIISSKKIYSRIRILFPDFFKRNPLIKDEFVLFSVIKALFNDNYFYNKPLISKKYIGKQVYKHILLEQFGEKDIIKIDDAMSYIRKMNFHVRSSLDIINDLSDKFLLSDENTLINKGKIIINKYSLDLIKYNINLHCSNFGKMKLSKVYNFINYPNISLPWNKYLLFGIIKSYFKNDFEIVQLNSTNKFINIEFEVRRK